MSKTRFIVMRLDYPADKANNPVEMARDVEQFLEAVGAVANYAGRFGGTLAAVPVGHPDEKKVEELVEELWNGG